MNQINRMGLGLMLLAILLTVVGVYLAPPENELASVYAYINIIIAMIGIGMLAWE